MQVDVFFVIVTDGEPEFRFGKPPQSLNKLQLLLQLLRSFGIRNQFLDRLPVSQDLVFAADGLGVIAECVTARNGGKNGRQ
jgi:hypothetical protein